MTTFDEVELTHVTPYGSSLPQNPMVTRGVHPMDTRGDHPMDTRARRVSIHRDVEPPSNHAHKDEPHSHASEKMTWRPTRLAKP